MITKIISGGQTGADQAGLRAAKALGIATGGWVPNGCRTADGPAPWLVTAFGCQEHPSDQYAPRTVANLRSASMTIWFGDPDSAGGTLTIGTCKREWRPCVTVPFPLANNERARWIAVFRQYLRSPLWAPEVLNIAGNRERSNPGIGAFVEQFLIEILT